MPAPDLNSRTPDRARVRRTGALLLFACCCLLPPWANAASTLADLYQQVNPSVVVIYTDGGQSNNGSLANEQELAGLGSGVVISEDQILTAAHVVHAAESVEVEFVDGTRVAGEVISSEPRADLALVQLYAPYSAARPARLGDSDRVRIGDESFVIGNPYGIGQTLTWGHVSARHTADEKMADFSEAEFFQTDAAINQGNSGGPMFNMDGEVIGIVSHIQSKTGGNVGLGFAVTSNTARELIFNKKSFYSGFESVILRSTLAYAFNLPQPAGILVQRVAGGSFAERLGLRGGSIPATIGGRKLLIGGDVILEIAGIAIGDEQTLSDIRSKIDQLQVGDQLQMKVLRDGKSTLLSAYILV